MKKIEIDKKIINISVAVLISLLLAVASLSYNGGKNVQLLEGKIATLTTGQQHLIENYNSQDNKISELQKDNQIKEVELAKINTKLANIEVLLIEIKQDIKDK